MSAKAEQVPIPIPSPPSWALWRDDREQWKAEHIKWQASVDAAAATWNADSVVSLIGQLASHLARAAR